MLKLLLVFVGGGLGSVSRYGIGQLIARMTPTDLEPPHWLDLYPLATMLVNIIGCAIIGFAWAWALAKGQGQSPAMVFLIVGVLGGFTTFSSFGWETLELIQNQRFGIASLYVLMSLTLGLLGVFGGFTIGTAAFGTGAPA
jgi:fluoride exporter